MSADEVAALDRALTVRLAASPADFEAVAALRYRCYRREGVVAEAPLARMSDAFDGQPRHPVFLLHEGEALVASIRLGLLFQPGALSPTALAFPAEVQGLLAQGPLVDPNRFVIEGGASRRHPALHLFVLTLPFMAAAHLGGGHVLASVRPEHRAFYQRVLRCRQIAAPRPYPGLTADLALMAVRFADNSDAVIRRYPAFGLPLRHRALIATLPTPDRSPPDDPHP